MEIVWLVTAATLALTATIGALRAGARSWRPLALDLALLLASAGACHLIGQSKTGGFLAGIVGLLLSLLMLIAAGGMAAGAAGRWVWDRRKSAIAKATPAMNWDLWVIGAFAALALGLSALE